MKTRYDFKMILKFIFHCLLEKVLYSFFFFFFLQFASPCVASAQGIIPYRVETINMRMETTHMVDGDLLRIRAFCSFLL